MLSVELIYTIFDYLSFDDILKAFFTHEKRLSNATLAYPASIDLSKVFSDNTFQNYLFHCRSLKVFGDDRRQLQVLHSHLRLEALRAISFTDISLFTLVTFVKQLPMHQIESIIITKIRWRNIIPKMDQEAWPILMSAGRDRLRHLHLPVEICFWSTKNILLNLLSLSDITFEHISISKMWSFIRHMPNLRRLKSCLCLPAKKINVPDLIMIKLTHLYINIEDVCSFESLHKLSNVCPNLTYFNLQIRVLLEDKKMTDPTEWKIFVETYLPNLVYLRLRLRLFLSMSFLNEMDLQELFNDNQYWLRRQPDFQVIIEKVKHFDDVHVFQ
jgi:hypothetical protein